MTASHAFSESDRPTTPDIVPEATAQANLAALRNSAPKSRQEVVEALVSLNLAETPPSAETAKTFIPVSLNPQAFGRRKSDFDPRAQLQKTEIEVARRFNFELPEKLDQAVEAMAQAVRDVTRCEDCAILTFDEETGVYTVLQVNPDSPKQEMSHLSDTFLQDLMQADTQIHSHLVLDGKIVGMVAVSHKRNQKPFEVVDEILLELLSPYLATKLHRFQSQQDALIQPYRQALLIDLSTRLVAAVDQDEIIAETLDLFWSRFGFSVSQYVVLNEDSPENPGTGFVLVENNNGKLKSLSHAGLESKRRVIKDYAGMISLLASGYRKTPYLLVTGGMLGDKSLATIFGVKKAYTVLIIPVFNVETGKIQGTINLFQTSQGEISPSQIDLAMTVGQLTSNALNRARVLEKALAMATTDELTGILNRRGLYERLGAEIERLRRHPAPMAIALFDVDHFKRFNDTYGHLSGDCVLQAIGNLLNTSLRKSDIVCRFGGEEFAILLPETPLEAARELMERLRLKIQAMTVTGYQNETLQVTVSIGLAPVLNQTHQSHLEIAAEALAKADEALYNAKASGRNQVQVI